MKKLVLSSLLLSPIALFAAEASVVTQSSGIGVFGFGFAVIGSALAIGIIGLSAATAIGRNPSASKEISSAILLPMVLAEGLGIIAVVLAFVK